MSRDATSVYLRFSVAIMVSANEVEDMGRICDFLLYFPDLFRPSLWKGRPANTLVPVRT